MSVSDLIDIEVKSRTELGAWLAANHAQTASIWLTTYKKSSPFYLSFGDMVSELLCWGWIDGRKQKVDDVRTRQMISPRSPKSNWSGVNKAKVEELRASGEMQPSGEAAIEIAQANGMWEFLDDVEGHVRPFDLESADGFDLAIWEAWPASVKQITLYWIKTAKTDATRGKRIADVVDSQKAGLRPTPARG